MRPNVRGIAAPLAVLALVTSACAKSKPVTPKATSIPVISIGDCVTDQGTRAPTPTKGVDFKTQLKQPGVLNVGSDNNFPPFEEIKPGASGPSGFDVDLYREVAKRLGLTAKSTTTSFDALFTQSLPRGQFDIGVSAITIKESRKKTVDFTVPYFRADLSLAVNGTRTPNIKSIDDLGGLTIGAQTGTTGEDCAKAIVKVGKAKEVKSYSDTGPAFDDLVAGGIAAIVNDRPASERFIAKRPSLKVVQVIETKEQYGFAIGKQKPDLREAINQKLLEIMRDGTYATMYRTWFDKTEPPFVVPIANP